MQPATEVPLPQKAKLRTAEISGRVWASAILFLSLLFFFWPVKELPGIFGSPVGLENPIPLLWQNLNYDPYVDITETDNKKKGGPIYEVASIASYSLIAILTILSFTGPLLLVYFNQVVDGIQQLLDPVFGYIRSCKKTSDGQVPADLEAICDEGFTILEDAQKAGARLKPIFNMIVALAVSLLLISLILHATSARSIYMYTFMARTFSVSIVLGISSILGIWYLARQRFPNRRISMLEMIRCYVRSELMSSQNNVGLISEPVGAEVATKKLVSSVNRDLNSGGPMDGLAMDPTPTVSHVESKEKSVWQRIALSFFIISVAIDALHRGKKGTNIESCGEDETR